MGGCRCTFRKCAVNTLKFPRMHFFHYPLKDGDRLEIWIKYACYSQIRDLSLAQAKNKVVCALHFRDEYFMNYKKDRLVPYAIPTLERLKNGLVLDYSLSDRPKPMALPPTTEKHLIPPKGYIVLGLPEDFFMCETTNIEMLDDEEEEVSEPVAKRCRTSKISHLQLLEDEVVEISVPAVEEQRRRTTKIAAAPKILNKGVRLLSTSAMNSHFEEDEISLTDDTIEETEYNMLPKRGVKNESTTVINANLDEIEFLPTEKDDCGERDDLIIRELYDQTVDAFESEVTELKKECNRAKNEAEVRVAQLAAELLHANEKAQLAEVRAEAAESSAKEWQKKFESCQAENQKLLKTDTSTTQKPTVAAFGQLSKPQLFNGIKKYLSASMTALVRMEMFGGAERPWKPDEKQASVELLRLGEKVYKYFSDEWRFRLPPKKLVEQWKNEVTEEDEDDL